MLALSFVRVFLLPDRLRSTAAFPFFRLQQVFIAMESQWRVRGILGNQTMFPMRTPYSSNASGVWKCHLAWGSNLLLCHHLPWRHSIHQRKKFCLKVQMDVGISSFKKLFWGSLDWKYVAVLIKASCICFWYYFQESLLHFFNNALTSTPTFMDSRGNWLTSSLTSISSSAFPTLQFTTSALKNFSIYVESFRDFTSMIEYVDKWPFSLRHSEKSSEYGSNFNRKRHLKQELGVILECCSNSQELFVLG